METTCGCGCGQAVAPGKTYIRGHHWKVLREANGVPSYKICEQCEQPYTRESIGNRQSNIHWLQRRYCSEACHFAAKAVDPSADRVCPVCERELPPALFYATGSYCKDCSRRTKRKLSPEMNRVLNLRNMYGITPQDYDALARAQGGVCAICRGDETTINYRNGEIYPLAVDHCHDSGKVRALLCSKCNKGLGCFGHDIEQMRLAIKYLEKHMNRSHV